MAEIDKKEAELQDKRIADFSLDEWTDLQLEIKIAEATERLKN